MTDFFKRIGPFENFPVLARQGSRDDAPCLCLRHVDIIRDLYGFYLWLNDPHLLTNSGLPQKGGRLIRHFKRSLESPNRQSFLVESLSLPVCQFDISLIKIHELYFRIPTSAGDCILTYMLKGASNWSARLKDALALQLDYFFSFPEPKRIWVTIPNDQPALQELFQEAGFSLKTAYTAQQFRYVIFFLRRPSHMPPSLLPP